MTENEWQQSTDPDALLQFLARKRSRKQRLAAVAACRLFDDLLTDARSREALDVAERFADDRATAAELESAYAGAEAADEQRFAERRDLDPTAEGGEDAERRVDALHQAAWAARHAAGPEPEHAFFHLSFLEGTEFLLANVLRDVFGPQRLVAFDPAWLTPAVTALAHAVYEERAFADMPVLADALEDAGCTDETILAHCRLVDDLAGHVRGCWVLDLLLGKSGPA